MSDDGLRDCQAAGQGAESKGATSRGHAAAFVFTGQLRVIYRE